MGTGSQSHGWRGVASTASASSGDTTVLSRVTDVRFRIFETIESSITSSHGNTDDNVYDRHQKIQSALLNGRILLHLQRVRARLSEERSALSCIPGPCIQSHYDGPTYSEGDIATRSKSQYFVHRVQERLFRFRFQIPFTPVQRVSYCT